MSLESQYGTKKIFSHQFQIYVKLENCDFSLKDRIFPVFCRIFNPKLFDISVAKFEEKIRSDRLRLQEAKDEDIQFFLDQKGERNMYISSELDKAFESSVKNKGKRHWRMEEAKVKEQEALNLGDGSRNELEVSFDSSAGTGSEGTISSTDDEDSADESLRHSCPSKAKVRFLTFA